MPKNMPLYKPRKNPTTLFIGISLNAQFNFIQVLVSSWNTAGWSGVYHLVQWHIDLKTEQKLTQFRFSLQLLYKSNQ